jgi:hypothetical protein
MDRAGQPPDYSVLRERIGGRYPSFALPVGKEICCRRFSFGPKGARVRGIDASPSSHQGHYGGYPSTRDAVLRPKSRRKVFRKFRESSSRFNS